ncbi:MAG TPA: CheR family methyltransferase [Mycobacteriales bacterium]|nr:CheR family methyltransferase [Mycobacteriales bacterium]
MSRPALTDEQFASIASLLHDAAGLTFDESRRDSLTFSVAERMAATGCADVAAYLALLISSGGAQERQALLDEVTIPETHFFRNPPQVRALRTYVLPELLRQAAAGRRLRIWSAGCSTGEEAYTIAIMIRELLPAGADWDVKVIATDVSTRALATASTAHYNERSFVMTDPLDLARWFVLDTVQGSWVVRDEVRELVEFKHHNLVTDQPQLDLDQVDLILCRNVTIYFDRETTRRLMKRLHDRLRDGGYLFLGHAETLWQISDDFSLVSLGDAFVYRRLETAPDGERRRWVLRDRRTEDELRPTRTDRRRATPDRRGGAAEDSRAPDASAALEPPAPTRDPLDAVRGAIAQGRYAEAADLAEEVVSATPLWAQAYYLHGVALTNLGRDADALVVLRKAVYLDAEHGFAHFMLGGALERLDEPVAASRSYRAAARTLGRRPVDGVAGELGGRSVAELAALCEDLAERAEQASRAQERSS